MEKIDLFVKSGEYVTTVTVPIFNPKAEVITWGSRTFIRNPEDGKYYEGLNFVALG